MNTETESEELERNHFTETLFYAGPATLPVGAVAALVIILFETAGYPIFGKYAGWSVLAVGVPIVLYKIRQELASGEFDDELPVKFVK